MKQEVTIAKSNNEYILTIEDDQKINQFSIPQQAIFEFAKGLNHLSDSTSISGTLGIITDSKFSHIQVPSWAKEKVKYLVISEALDKASELIGLITDIFVSYTASLIVGGIPRSVIKKHSDMLGQVLGLDDEKPLHSVK